MIKKPQVLSIVFVICIFALFAAATNSDSKAGIASKKSHAEKLWQSSGHADSAAEAFIHWDEDGEIEEGCAKCHSTPGFQDFIADGTVDGPAALGTTVECGVCHTSDDGGPVRSHTSVIFPSGAVAENLGPEALCMECHQGRASTVSVDSAVAGAGVGDDTASSKLSFINIHYYAAAANQFGTEAKGGYEYSGKMYDARFSHVIGYNACVTCHNPHSLEVDMNRCNTCHTGISDPKDIRYFGSFTDYDGDGDMEEGMYYEIQDLEHNLYTAIQIYAQWILQAPVAYDSHAYPYFFHDNNANGVADPAEANYGNRYTSFSPRLLRAAYNFQVAKKDPNGYAHGGKYIIELLYDSIEDLNKTFTNSVGMDGIHRGDEGHFDGSTEAWRHWDEDGEVSTSCAKCHSATGLQVYLETGEIAEAQHTANGMLCTTCHFTGPPSLSSSARGAVTFPSGEVEDMGDSSNICLNCHQGRASKYTVDSTVAKEGPYTFINIHYYPTAAVLFGTEVKGGYEYEGMTYAGQKQYANHMGRFDTCVECHMGTKSDNRPFSNHNVYKPNQADCVFCHGQDVSQPNPGSDPTKFKFSGIRPASTPDYDGDGITTESIANEIKGLEMALYAQIQNYAANIIGSPVIYDSHAYPYFFYDLNGNGAVDPGEGIYPNQYKSFDAKLLKAAYNYQVSKKEPHGYIHNSRYVAQLLVDSILDLGGTNIYTWR